MPRKPRFKPAIVSMTLPGREDAADRPTGKTGVDVISELDSQHARVTELLRCLDHGRWWPQSEPCQHADEVHAQVAVIKRAVDKVELAVEAMRGL